ncbi:MAG: type IX secretion system sortase PorU [Bacteroidetes bacterium]|nr:type IX secretion system sortase PorU [Bacteroidota bacterium]
MNHLIWLLLLIPALGSAQTSLYFSPDSLFKTIRAGQKFVAVVASPFLHQTPSGDLLYIHESHQIQPGTQSGWIRIGGESDSRNLAISRLGGGPGITDPGAIGFFDGKDFYLATSCQTGIRQDLQTSGLLKRQQNVSYNPVLESGRWVTARITEEGVYRITGSDLKKWGFPTDSDLRNLKVFTVSGYQPEKQGLEEIPLLLRGTEPEGFQESSEYFFYTTSASGTVWNTSQGRMTFYDDQLTSLHQVFITIGTTPGRRMQTGTVPGTQPAREVREGWKTVFINPDSENLLNTGQIWMGSRLVSNSTQAYTLRLPEYKTGTTLNFQTSVVSQYKKEQDGKITVMESGRPVITNLTTGSVISFTGYGVIATSKTSPATIPALLQDDRVMLDYQFTATGSASAWVDWLTIDYQKSLSQNKVQTDFYLRPANQETWTVSLSGFPNSNIEVLSIDDPLNPVRVSPAVVNGGEFSFNWLVTPSAPNRFWAFNTREGFRAIDKTEVFSPISLSPIIDQNPDYLIITIPAFKAEATRLLNHRKSQGWNGAVVLAGDIYSYYSGGKPNLYAIRQFLADCYTASGGGLKNVLLFGDTSFDFKNRMKKETTYNHLPTFQSPESFSEEESYATDDEYSYLLSDGLHKIGIGRLPVRTVKEADIIVSKLIRYDTESEPGDWRSLVSLVADDGLTTSTDDEDLHVSNAETVAAQIPGYLTRNKLYIVNFPTIVTSQGRRKPEAASALVRLFNSGSAVVNYSGHGNTRVWTHERVLEIAEFLPQLTNQNRLPFVITATCDFGKFDDPDLQSAAEQLVTWTPSGAVGLFTTTRVVFTNKVIGGSNNLALNYHLFRTMYKRKPDGRNPSLGEIYTETKNIFAQRSSSSSPYIFSPNVKKFSLLADPAMQLILPERNGLITKNGSVLREIDPMVVETGNQFTLNGYVAAVDGTRDSGFTGKLDVRIKSEPVRVNITDWQAIPGAIKSYQIDGPDLFRGTSTITGGDFSVTFMVPRDVLPNNLLPGRISGYLYSGNQTGVLKSPALYFISGTGHGIADSTGPTIRLYVNDPTYQPGQPVAPTGFLIADVTDESGINMTGLGIGHQLTGVLNGDQGNPIDLGPYYRSAEDDYTSGSIRFPLESLPAGPHSIEVTVWDSFNNFSRSSTRFTITGQTSLELGEVMPYPNPFSSEVRFYVPHNLSDVSLRMTAKIYTLNGLLVRTLDQTFAGSSASAFLVWDGRDSDTDEVANGLYMVRLQVTDLTGGVSRQSVLKILKNK